MVTTYAATPTREEVEMQLQQRAREYALAVIGSVHDRKLMDQLQPEFKLRVLKVIKFFVTSSEADCKRAIARRKNSY